MLALLAVALAAAPAIAPQPASTPAVRVQGIVTDAHGEPVPAAEVWLTPASAPQEVLAAGHADGQGFFVLATTAERRLKVHATAPGKVQVHSWVDPAIQSASALIELRAWDAVTVRGRVVDPAGEPVAGATVVAGPIRRVGLLIDPVEAKTGLDGHYELIHAPMGEVLLSAWADDHAPVTRQAMFQPREEQHLAFGEDPPRSFTVAVNGLPEVVSPAGWRVEMYRGTGLRVMPRAFRLGTLDAAGQWEFRGLPAMDNVHIRVSDPSSRFYCEAARWFPQGESDRLEPKALPTRRLDWQVTLVGPDDQPLPDQRLLLSVGGTSAVVKTAEDGTASITAPCGNNRRCSARLVGSSDWVLGSPDHQDGDGPLYTDEKPEPVTLKAIPAASLRGRLADNKSQALSGCHVVLEEWDRNRLPRWVTLAHARSDGQGRFAMPGLFPCQRPLRLRVPWTRTLLPIGGKLASGRCLDLETVVAEPAGTIEGRVIGATGAPIAGARVFLVQILRPGGGDQAELLTDADGRFSFSPAAPGRWAPSLYWAENRGSLKSVGETFEVLAGRTMRLELESSRL